MYVGRPVGFTLGLSVGLSVVGCCVGCVHGRIAHGQVCHVNTLLSERNVFMHDEFHILPLNSAQSKAQMLELV